VNVTTPEVESVLYEVGEPLARPSGRNLHDEFDPGPLDLRERSSVDELQGYLLILQSMKRKL
jgi:hypothetical protein